jgi:hypothetical protein
MMRYVLLVLLTLGLAAPGRVHGAPSLAADTTVFTLDPARSVLTFRAWLSANPLGTDDAQSTSAVAGSVSAVLEGGAPASGTIHIPAFHLVLTDAMTFDFDYGLFGSIVGDAAPGALTLVLKQPGPATVITNGTFLQTGNSVAMQGILVVNGSGALGALFSDDTLDFAIDAQMEVGGTILGAGTTYTLGVPVDFSGRFSLSATTTLDVILQGQLVGTAPITTGREGAEAPVGFALAPAYPNPFNPRTTLTLAVDRPQHVRLAVYDLLGREVALVFAGPLGAAPRHTFTLDAGGLPGGTYLVRATGETGSALQRLVLVK